MFKFGMKYQINAASPLNPNRVGMYCISGNETLKSEPGYAVLSIINTKDETIYFAAEEKYLEEVK